MGPSVPMMMAKLAPGTSSGSSLPWDCSQTSILSKTPQCHPGSCVWHVDGGDGDERGCCAGDASGANEEGGKREVEGNGEGPVARLGNACAALSAEHRPLPRSQQLCDRAESNITGLLQLPVFDSTSQTGR